MLISWRVTCKNTTKLLNSMLHHSKANIAGWIIHHEWIDVFPVGTGGICYHFGETYPSFLEWNPGHMPESYQTHTVRGLHRFVGISDDP